MARFLKSIVGTRGPDSPEEFQNLWKVDGHDAVVLICLGLLFYAVAFWSI